MRKFVAVSVLLLQCMGSIMHPIGDTKPVNYRQMYQQCSVEDPDITPLDFVFGHLLNLESVMGYFEGENESNEDEHQFPQSLEPSTVIALTVPQTVHFDFTPQICHEEKITHGMYHPDFHTAAFSADVFRPPIM